MDPNTFEVFDTYFETNSGEDIPTFGNANTNWQREVFGRTPVSSNVGLTIAGGGDKTNYSVALNSRDENGIAIKSQFRRYGIRAAIDSKLRDWLKVGATVGYNGTKNESGLETGTNFGNTISAIRRPDTPIFDENGEFATILANLRGTSTPGQINASFRYENPVAEAEKTVNNTTTNFLGNAYFELNLLEGLTFKTDANLAIFDSKTERFRPKRASTFRFGQDFTNSGTSGNNNNKYFTANFRLNYNKTFGKNTINAMAGHAIDRSNNFSTSFSFIGTPDDYALTYPSSALEITEARGGEVESGIDSYFSRVQYGYDNRYTLTANIRSDKSSKFGPGNRVGIFPSIAANWNVSNEKFLSNSGFVDRLTLRGSYGQTGSSNVNDFRYNQFFAPGIRANGQYQGESAIIPDLEFPNENIGWETTTEWNIGVDFALGNNTFFGSFDFYNRYTDDVLAPSFIYVESGAKEFSENIADISNKGWELELGANIVRTQNVNWSVDFNISTNKGVIEKLNNANLSSGDLNRYAEGNEIGSIYSRVPTGIFQTDEEVDELNALSPTGTYINRYTGAGDVNYKDVNGDGRITSADVELIGNSTPDFFGGFATNFNYRNISLFAGFQYALGGERRYLLNGDLKFVSSEMKNMGPEALNFWRSGNTDTDIPNLRYGYFNNDDSAVPDLFDASYLRLKVVTLNYSFPKEHLGKAFSSLDIYAAGTNLLTFTDYPGLDPESSSAGSVEGPGIDYSTFPFARTFTLGVKIGL